MPTSSSISIQKIVFQQAGHWFLKRTVRLKIHICKMAYNILFTSALTWLNIPSQFGTITPNVSLIKSKWGRAQHFLQDRMPAQWRLRLACAFRHSKQNFCRPCKESLDVWTAQERKAMSLIGGHAQYEILFPGSNDTAQAARWTLDNYTRFTSLTDMLRRRRWRSLE